MTNHSLHTNQERPTRYSSGSLHKGMLQVDSTTLVTAQLEALTKKFDQLQAELSKSKEPQKTNDCQQSMVVEEVNYVARQNNAYNNNYNPGWRNHPNFSWRDGNNNQGPPGFDKKLMNQNPPFQQKPQYHNSNASSSQQQGGMINLEGVLAQFISSSETIFKSSEKRFAKHDADLRNQKASLQNIENQVGQIAQQLSAHQQGDLPSNTVINPNANVSAITLRSGKATNDSQEQINDQEKEEVTLQPKETFQKKKPSVKPYEPPIPYPGRLKKEKTDIQYEKFLELFKQLHINIPFIEALS